MTEKVEYKVVDNFLKEEDFKSIQSSILSGDFPWHITQGVSYIGSGDGYYFSHLIYSRNAPSSRWFDILFPVFFKIEPIAIHRIKVNFHPTTQTLIKHSSHIDLKESHKGAILYLNTNDGKTILNDGTEIDSIENRMLFFDPSIPHRSTSCTNDPIGRFNINFNYF